jgi:beta-lactamase class A
MTKHRNKTRWSRSAPWLAIAFSAGFMTAFFFFGTAFRKESNPLHVEVEQQKGFRLINPLLDFGVPFIEVPLSKDKINTYVADKTQEGSIVSVSVYYRQMNNGTWFGINEDEKFRPASMLKVPILMSALKQAESRPDLLEKEIIVDKIAFSTPEDEALRDPLQEGGTYTLFDLLRRMILYSDNNGLIIASRHLDDQVTQKMFMDLGIGLPDATEKTDLYVSVKDYSRFFRVLYNASYLNRQSSEMALKMLTDTTFDEGLVAGVKAGTLVAHKFGRTPFDKNLQLHDCGIVYYPENPYLLCVMTRGMDFNKMQGVIGDISKMVYDEVANQSAKGD